MTRKIRPRGEAKGLKSDLAALDQVILRTAIMATGSAKLADAFLMGRHPFPARPITPEQGVAAGYVFRRAEGVTKRLPPRASGFVRPWFSVIGRNPTSDALQVGWAVDASHVLAIMVEQDGKYRWFDPVTGESVLGEEIPETVWAEIDMLLLSGPDGDLTRKGLLAVPGPLPDARR